MDSMPALQATPPMSPAPHRRGSIGMSYVRKKREESEALRLASRTERLPVPASRELVEKKVHDMLREGERKQAALQAEGRDDSRSALSDLPANAKKKPPRRVPSARATAVGASRTFLAGVLVPATPNVATPLWKEDVVDRVRRRVGERAASAAPTLSQRGVGAGSPGRGTGGGDSPDALHHRPASPIFSPRPPAASPRRVQSSRATRGGADDGQPASPFPPSLAAAHGGGQTSTRSGISRSGNSQSGDSRPWSARAADAVQGKSRQFDHYRDALSDQLLVCQLQEKEEMRLAEEMRQVGWTRAQGPVKPRMAHARRSGEGGKHGRWCGRNRKETESKNPADPCNSARDAHRPSRLGMPTVPICSSELPFRLSPTGRYIAGKGKRLVVTVICCAPSAASGAQDTLPRTSYLLPGLVHHIGVSNNPLS